MPTIIDPTPQGWLYGFPKELPDDVEDVIEWLMENGYPEELAAYCKYRMWHVDENSTDN